MTTGLQDSGGARRAPARRLLLARPPAGFTLMELVLVLLVMSVVLTLASPSLRGFFASRRTADAALAMMSLTKWARSQAIACGSPVRLNVDSASGTYWVTVQEGGTFVDADDEIGQPALLPEGASAFVRADAADEARSYVQFYPNGRHDAATIEIEGRQGEVYRIAAPSATEPFRVISPSEAP